MNTEPNDTLPTEPVAPEQDSIADSLNAAFDELESGDSERPEQQQQFAPDPQQPQAPSEAPQHWPQQYREAFARQTPEAQQFLLERHRAMEGDYTRKSQEVAEWRRQHESQLQLAEQVNQTWGPVAQQFYARQGLGPAEVQRMAAAWLTDLQRDPRGTILKLSQEMGIDPAQLIEQQEYVDPVQAQVQQVARQQAELQQALQQHQQQQQQHAQQEQLQRLVEPIVQENRQVLGAFESAKDERGQPRYPHFAQLSNEIGFLLEVDPTGRKPPMIPISGDVARDVDTAYHYAVRARGLNAPAPSQRSRGRDAVLRARQAGSGLSSAGGGGSEPASLRDALEQAFDQHVTP